MNHTTNYNLPQWEDSDRVTRSDVNDAMSAIDAAIPRVVVGWYSGDGQQTQIINLGFTPSAVLVFPRDGLLVSGAVRYSGFALPNMPAQDNYIDYLAIVDGGFRAAYWTSGASDYLNQRSKIYYYIAIG